MGRCFLGLAALAALGAPACLSAADGQGTTRLPDYRERGVADPRAYVAETYAAYRRATDELGLEPESDYAHSDRLRDLFEIHDAAAGCEPGALDFDWWVNGQDWQLSEVTLSEERDGPDRRTITARFANFGRANTSRFKFVRQRGRWFLDDIVNGTGRGDRGWTLSALLQARP